MTGACAMPHMAPQPPPVVDIVAEAAKLQEAMARGAQKAQLARAPESGGDAGQSGVVMAARADAEEEVGRLQEEELVGARRSTPPAKERRKPPPPSARGLGSRVSQRRRNRCQGHR